MKITYIVHITSGIYYSTFPVLKNGGGGKGPLDPSEQKSHQKREVERKTHQVAAEDETKCVKGDGTTSNNQVHTNE